MVLDWSGYRNTNVTKLPCVCQGCGETVFKTINKLDFQKSCYCLKCSYTIKTRQTCLRKYGCEHPLQNEDIIKKVKKSQEKRTSLDKKKSNLLSVKTCLKRYGVSHPSKRQETTNKRKQTCLKRYGVDCVAKVKEFRDKGKETFRKKYGINSSLQLPKTKVIIKAKYGVNNVSQNKSIHCKKIETMNKNGTCGKSKPEEMCYNLLCDKYGKENIKRNWNKDSRYPFPVDFYVISIDLFIECNFFFTHGKEKYNSQNIAHQSILEKWKTIGGNFYARAIYSWTVRDPLKIKTATDNSLNYFAPYTMTEFLLWYNEKA